MTLSFIRKLIIPARVSAIMLQMTTSQPSHLSIAIRIVVLMRRTVEYDRLKPMNFLILFLNPTAASLSFHTKRDDTRKLTTFPNSNEMTGDMMVSPTYVPFRMKVEHIQRTRVSVPVPNRLKRVCLTNLRNVALTFYSILMMLENPVISKISFTLGSIFVITREPELAMTAF